MVYFLPTEDSPAVSSAATGIGLGSLHQHSEDSLRHTLTKIDGCIRQWKAARHQGETVLTYLSNTLLLRTYIDKGQNNTTADISGGLGGSSNAGVWGALTGAGNAIARVSMASEARARRLHSELAALQDAMLTVAGEIRRHAEDVRRIHDLGTTGIPEAGGHGSAAGVNSTADVEKVRPDGSPSAVNRQASRLSSSVSENAGHVVTGGENIVRVGDGRDVEQWRHVVGGGYAVGDVASCTAEVSEMLMKEALVTATITQGVPGLVKKGDREGLIMHAAAWQMQPYVDARRLKELQTMVAGPSAGSRRGVAM